MKDEQFIRGKNPMTKMEVRNAIVDYLDLDTAKNVLEIGAGTGSVTVQMAKMFPHLSISAIEYTETGIELLKTNMAAHGVDTITPILGKAPQAFEGLTEKYDRVYIGGSGSELLAILNALEHHGFEEEAIVVFSTITLENTAEIGQYLFENSALYTEIEGSQIAASRLETLGRYHYFKPLNPCTIFKAKFTRKGASHE